GVDGWTGHPAGDGAAGAGDPEREAGVRPEHPGADGTPAPAARHRGRGLAIGRGSRGLRAGRMAGPPSGRAAGRRARPFRPAAGPTDDAAALPPEAERLEAHWTAIMNEYGDYFAPGARPPFRELVAPDGGSPKTADVLAGLMRFFFHDIVRHGRLLVSIVVL